MMLHFKKFLLQITKARKETTWHITELTHKRIMKLFTVVQPGILSQIEGKAAGNSGKYILKFDTREIITF